MGGCDFLVFPLWQGIFALPFFVLLSVFLGISEVGWAPYAWVHGQDDSDTHN